MWDCRDFLEGGDEEADSVARIAALEVSVEGGKRSQLLIQRTVDGSADSGSKVPGVT